MTDTPRLNPEAQRKHDEAKAKWSAAGEPCSKPELTPKQQYEARKAERKKLKEMEFNLRNRTEQEMLLDMLDRFVTAHERIADALVGVEINLRKGP